MPDCVRHQGKTDVRLSDIVSFTDGRLSNRPESNRLNHGVGFCSDDSDTPFLAVALAVLGLLELSLALGLGSTGSGGNGGREGTDPWGHCIRAT